MAFSITISIGATIALKSENNSATELVKTSRNNVIYLTRATYVSDTIIVCDSNQSGINFSDISRDFNNVCLPSLIHVIRDEKEIKVSDFTFRMVSFGSDVSLYNMQTLEFIEASNRKFEIKPYLGYHITSYSQAFKGEPKAIVPVGSSFQVSSNGKQKFYRTCYTLELPLTKCLYTGGLSSVVVIPRTCHPEDTLVRIIQEATPMLLAACEISPDLQINALEEDGAKTQVPLKEVIRFLSPISIEYQNCHVWGSSGDNFIPLCFDGDSEWPHYDYMGINEKHHAFRHIMKHRNNYTMFPMKEQHFQNLGKSAVNDLFK